MLIRYLYLIAGAAILGCAPASGTPGTSGTGAVRSNNKLLTAEEIASAHADVGTAYDAVSRLRPRWLSTHGVSSYNTQGAATESAIVFVDGQHYGDINSLRNIEAFHVADIRYYDATESALKFGLQGGTNGVIEVSIRTR